MEVGAFNNLNYLQELESKKSLPRSVFFPARHCLKVLDIRMNLKSKDLDLVNYPVSVAELHKLVGLGLDCLRGKKVPSSRVQETNKFTKINFHESKRKCSGRE